MPLSSFREYSLSLRDAADLITYTRSHIGLVGNLYVGAPIAFCAALLYAANKRDTKLTALFVSVMIAFLFCLYLFAPILRWIPIANKVREVNWWSCYLVALTIPLGALGLQWILDLNSTDMSTKIFGRKPIQLSVVALVATLVVALIAKTGTPIREALMICAGFSLLIAGLAWPARTRPFHQTMASAIVIICTLIPVLSYGRYSPSGTLLVRQDHVQTRYEAEQIAAATSDSDKFRFAVSAKLNNFRDFIATLSNLDLRCVGGNISPQEYDKFRLLFFPSPVVADLYGVKYQVISHGDHQPGDIAIDPAISLHVNAQALPRLFFVQGGMQITASPVEALLAIKDDSPLHFFVEAKDIPPHLDFSPYTKGDSVISLPVVSDSSPVAVKASLLVKGAGLLVLNEDPAGRWNATIDGRVVTPIRINGFQTAFPVLEAGQHDFEITRPTHLY
jgi:hypothetical protein